MNYIILVFICFLSLHSQVSASFRRGFYGSLSYSTNKQDNDIRDYYYTRTTNVQKGYTQKVLDNHINSTQVNNAIYSFYNTNDYGYASFASLKSAIDGKYVTEDTLISVLSHGLTLLNHTTGLVSGTSTQYSITTTTNAPGTYTLITYSEPSGSCASGGQVCGNISMIPSQFEPVYEAGRTLLRTAILSNLSHATANGGNGGKPYDANFLLNKDSDKDLVFAPLAGSIAGVPGEVTQTMYNSLTGAKQLQRIMDVVQHKQDGIDFALGYKFRPFQRGFFIAPEIGYTFFYDHTDKENLYYNGYYACTTADCSSKIASNYGLQSAYNFTTDPSNTQQASVTGQSGDLTQESYITTPLEYSTLNVTDLKSAVVKLGLNNHLYFMRWKRAYGLYGLLGVANADVRFKNTVEQVNGFKYGLGGEIFLNQKLALFGEFSRVDFGNVSMHNTTTYDFRGDTTSNITSVANHAEFAERQIRICNSITSGTNPECLTVKIASLFDSTSSIEGQINETIKMKLLLTQFKFGLTYYI